MSRLDLLRMKRERASYGPPLTPYELIELRRLEDELDDLRYARIANLDAPRPAVENEPPPLSSTAFDPDA